MLVMTEIFLEDKYDYWSNLHLLFQWHLAKQSLEKELSNRDAEETHGV
jgi:hypothetical protein